MIARLASAQVDEIAGDWVAREDARALTASERAELEAWLAADNRHLGAYRRLRAAARRLDRLAALKSDQAPAAAPPPTTAPPRPARPMVSRRLAAGLAFAAVLAGGVGIWANAQPRSYRTEIGEMRRVTLSDGSLVELNTDTALKVAYSANARDIWLQRGEGNFIVAKNKLRPFVVHVGEATFTAVGTVFSVRAEQSGPVRLTVSEGVVSVKPRQPERPAYVSALQEAAVEPKADAAQVANLSVGEINRRMAWTDGRVALAGETLADAAAEFNRYNERRLIVAPAVAGVRVGGVFRTSEVETFARTAAASLGLNVQVEPGGDIRIDAASAPS